MDNKTRTRLILLVLAIGAAVPVACETRDTGGMAGTSRVTPVGSGGATSEGTGGSGDPCEGVEVTKADCPPGSAKAECFCLRGSQPCLGLDEETCESVRGPTGYCEPIHAGSGGEGSGCQRTSTGYIGCASVPWYRTWMDASTCTHPPGNGEACCIARDELIPDGWPQCGGCDCTSGILESECPAGSQKAECCCHFPDSNPCEGVDQGLCTVIGNWTHGQALCHPVMGHAWDPTTMQPTGPEIYIGCRSQCVVEQPHGQPTCTHAPDSTTCGVAEDARIPDGWSTDCSVCTSE